MDKRQPEVTEQRTEEIERQPEQCDSSSIQPGPSNVDGWMLKKPKTRWRRLIQMIRRSFRRQKRHCDASDARKLSKKGTRKKGQVVRSEARNMARRVIKRCDEEARVQGIRYRVQQSTLRASDYTGLSTRTIHRIRKASKAISDEQSLSTPGEKRPRRKESARKFHCTEEDKAVIRQIISEFYTEKERVPTGKKLLVAIRQKIPFRGTVHSLYRVLKSMGFKWKRSQIVSKMEQLTEQPAIVAWRSKYLKALNSYRQEKRNIVYVDETWVEDNMVFSKCWQSNDIKGIQRSVRPSRRYIIVHAGGQSGFVQGAELIFKAKSTTGDYHGQMNASNFEKWLSEKLLPNIAPRSVIVMDNAPFHSVWENKPPSKESRKEVMIRWLAENEIPYTENMKKSKLNEIIRQNKRAVGTFKADELIKLSGHDVLRLPPYMCNLNPMELAWAKIKRIIRENNTGTLSSAVLKALTRSAIKSVTVEDWMKFCKHTEKIENQYREKDRKLDEGTQPIEATTISSDSDNSRRTAENLEDEC
ncbi:uncharacterized protein LOC143353694 [Halictus rubicundus]|uniref:uncharacterized protein LOC143353694 n=1 Tax=Halictus rubicundus TaxID=77578 RepID=UPI004035BCF6